MAQTIDLPRDEYERMIGVYSEILLEETAKDEPRALELQTSIKELTQAAQAAGLDLSDTSNPTAVRVNTALDGITPEFESLMQLAQKRQALLNYFKTQLETLPKTQTVTVPLNDTLVLLGLAQAA